MRNKTSKLSLFNRASLRLAWRDIVRHRVRSLLGITIVAIPVAAFLTAAALFTTAPPPAEVALQTVPTKTQAVLTATTIARSNSPFPQLPEGAPGPWMNDLEQQPATAAEIASALSPENSIAQFWSATDIMVYKSDGAAPGSTNTVSDAPPQQNISRIAVTEVIESPLASPHNRGIKLVSGAAPQDSASAVVSKNLQEKLALKIGDTVSVLAPPFGGWYSNAGRAGEVISNSQHTYRVVGFTDDPQNTVWSRPGWISTLTAKDSAGVTAYYLVSGPDAVTWEQLKQLNKLQVFGVSEHVLTHYPDATELYPTQTDVRAVMNLVGGIVIVGGLCLGLLFLNITPAFTVAVQESLHTFSLAAAVGASPRDVKQSVSLQGVIIGGVGGALGICFAVAAAVTTEQQAVLSSSARPFSNFPWTGAAILFGVAVLVGVIATLAPASRAARLSVSSGVKQARLQPDTARTRLKTLLASILFLAACAAGYAAIALIPADYNLPAAGGSSDLNGAAPALLALLAATGMLLTAALLALRPLLVLITRVCGKFSPILKLCLRDAQLHPGRFIPAAAGVLIAVTAVSYSSVFVGSFVANEQTRNGAVAAPGVAVLGANPYVSNDFSEAVFKQAVSELSAVVPVTGSAAIKSVSPDSKLHLGVLPPQEKQCPGDTAPDARSALTVGAEITCVPYEIAYNPGMTTYWLEGTNVYVLEPEAVLASRLPGASAAAATLRSGGAIVNNAATLASDGTAQIAVSSELLPDATNAMRTVTLPAAFLRGFSPPLAVSPETAHKLGVTKLQHLGEYLLTPAPLTESQLNAARDRLNDTTSVVRFGAAEFQYPWGGSAVLFALLAVLGVALAASGTTLALTRVQSQQLYQTVCAVGSAPVTQRVLNLYTAAVILCIGVPLGVVTGNALGVLHVGFNRQLRFTGDWLETVMLPGLQCGLLAVLCVAVLAVSQWFRVTDFATRGPKAG